MSVTVVVPITRFSHDLRFKLQTYDFREKCDHFMFEWMRSNLEIRPLVKVMIKDPDAWARQGAYHSEHLEEVHFTFANRTDAVRFKLACL